MKQWATAEWSLASPSVEGNPFDLEAWAVFTHADSDQTRTTGMFYAGQGVWKFRFTPTRPGRWSFTTRSANADLNGRSGTVTVEADPSGRGFIVAAGDKWARQAGGEDRLEAFVPQLVMYASPDHYHARPQKIDADIRTFLIEHGFNGLHVCVFSRWFDIKSTSFRQVQSKDPDPDVRTFEALELLIGKVHAAGGMVHLWAWGDDASRQNVKPFGLNGPADRRLQRYIAARLGPLPGWTLGYGYDLWEWVEGEQLDAWHAFLHEQMGWPHLLGARAHKNRLTQLTENLDYWSYEQHRPDYAKYVETIRQRPGKPSFSEDRFRIRQSGNFASKDYDEPMTRRGLYHSTMAGGVANIWGRLDKQPPELGSLPYQHPEWIRTNAEFFRGRFLLDMVRDNDRTDGACLRCEGGGQMLFYKEDADSVRVDLTGSAGAMRAVAVDALRPYREIDLGTLEPKAHTLRLPARSDWAIAVGEFPLRKP